MEEHAACDAADCIHYVGYVSAQTANFPHEGRDGRFPCQLFVDSTSCVPTGPRKYDTSDENSNRGLTIVGWGLTQCNFLSHVGFGCLGISYLMKNMVALRCCLILANIGLIAWGVVALNGAAAFSAAGWNMLFLFINSCRLRELLRTKKVPAGMKQLADPLLPVPSASGPHPAVRPATQLTGDSALK